MSRETSEKKWAYVINKNFEIIYSNSTLKQDVIKTSKGQPCYKVICQEESQCEKCPLRERNNGESILYDKLHQEWVRVDASKIDWPGVGECHVVLSSSIKEENHDSLGNTAERSEYHELLKLNYVNDTYTVIHHSNQGNNEDSVCDSLRNAVQKLAQKKIHPDDRKRFYDFWKLDRIGLPGVPEELNQPRHGEFRRLKKDGSIEWIQQLLIPAKHSMQDIIFVESFFNIIDVPEGSREQEKEEEDFFCGVEKKIKSAPDDIEWCMIAIDIEKFKLFNEWYGRSRGDKLLAGVSDCLHSLEEQKFGLAGVLSGDDFAFFMPYHSEKIKELCDAVSAQVKMHNRKMNVMPAFGIYRVPRGELSVYTMYDRAKLACSAVKGNYNKRIEMFEPQMLESLESELLLLSDIQNAFRNNEFTFVLQPKCNMNNGKIVGAEALVRWNSVDKGMVSPAVFIPFLEKTGLISELDTYVWEEVCRWQRSMLDRGRKTVPISVNISRIDITSIDVPAYFEQLIQKYELDPKFIELEITESTYAENTNILNQFVERLRSFGFRVLMDDFGSAYSSLNMLKDISIDVIKMDMRFLDLDESNAGKGTDIMETVCNMAQILGVGIIAEGVETERQKDLLQKAGCNCGQGYYFYRPLEVADFEKIIEDEAMVEENCSDADSTEILHLKDLINKNLLSQNMLSNILGAVAIYDVYEGQISLVRYNELYAAVLGTSAHFTEKTMNFGEQLYREEYDEIFQMFDAAKRNRHQGAFMDVRRRKSDGANMWLHLHVFFLYQRNGHEVYYSTVRDVTELRESNMALQFLNNDMPGGYYRHKNNRDADFTHISQRFLDILGYSRKEIKEYFDDKFINLVHPGDREKVRYSMTAIEETGGNSSQPCRMRSKSGYIYVLIQSRLVKYNGKEIYQGIILCNQDHYMWLNDDVGNMNAEDEATTLMPCGVFCSEADGEHQFGYVSNSMLHLLGYSRQAFEEKFQNSIANLVYEEDQDRVAGEIAEQIRDGVFTACEYRVKMADGSLKWVYNRGRLTTDINGKRWFYVCVTDYEYLKKKYQIQEWKYEKYRSLLEIPGMLVYDYDPMTDILTMEVSLEDGTRKNLIAENYLEKMEEYGFISEQDIGMQRKLFLEAIEQPVEGTTELRGRFEIKEEFRWFRFHYRSLADENGIVYRVIGRGDNVTDEKKSVSLLEQRAIMDSLTGLLNYESAKEKAVQLLAKEARGTLFVLDVDNFKGINDTWGHLAGNEVLKQIAFIIKTSFREEDILARFGGDEFLVFMPDSFTHEAIDEKAKDFFDKLSKIQFSENFEVNCSMGIAFAENQTMTFQELFKQADDALYQAKNSGKNKYMMI